LSKNAILPLIYRGVNIGLSHSEENTGWGFWGRGCRGR